LQTAAGKTVSPATKNTKPRVAIYSGNIPSTTFIEQTIRNLADKGLDIVLIGRVTRKISYPVNVKVVSVPGSFLPGLFFAIGQFLKLFFRNPSYATRIMNDCLRGSKNKHDAVRKMGLLFSLVNNKVNILHLQWGKTIQTTPEIFTLKDIKVALSFRGTHINISPLANETLANIYREYFPRINGFHAVSKAIVDEGVKYGADRDRIRVIYTSVNNSGIPVEAKKERTETIQIVSVGRHHWVKGYTYAFDAMKVLKERNVKFHYTLIAEGKMPEELTFQLNDLDLYGDVTVIPGMDHASLMQSLPKFDVFLLPSVGEGIANVVLEAMSAGLPSISTNCGGMAEVIRDGVNGFLVAPYSGEAIADAVRKMQTLSEGEIERIRIAGKETLQKFNPETQAEAFLSFYNSLAAA
jgi:colanic acid/amylovoran biosynthesis glycosyltransferase